MNLRTPHLLTLLSLFLLCTCGEPEPDGPHHTVTLHEKLTLSFEGPALSEQGAENPFTDYRLDVNFFLNDSVFVVPGFFAADGRAAETSADSGRVWQVRFRPIQAGEWRYEAVLRKGAGIAHSGSQLDGERIALADGQGTITVNPAGADERGRLRRVHPRYLGWSESGQVFLKGGAGSPENLLAQKDFDGTYRYTPQDRQGESATDDIHHFSAHVDDWQDGQPTWGNGKGKGLIGALNYLAGAGANSIYFLTMNIRGDGKDVWPYVDHETFDRFDVSKLDQWERVFDYADDELGLMLHMVLQETENETLLDGGDTGPQRRLYLREMIARFGHHRALTWNLGEENGFNEWSKAHGHQTTAQQKAFAEYVDHTDPYGNYISIHTHPTPHEIRRLFGPLVGDEHLDGLSVQLERPEMVHEQTRFWLDTTAGAGQPWIVSVDEIGPWWRGLDPDGRSDMNNQDSIRALMLWGNLMAGGGGIDHYFGALSPHNDLGMEDWRSRDRAWAWTGATIRFFTESIPVTRMTPQDELVGPGAYCLAAPDDTYLVYSQFGAPTTLDLKGTTGKYQLQIFEPATDDLSTGPVVTAAAVVELRCPNERDCAFLLTRAK